ASYRMLPPGQRWAGGSVVGARGRELCGAYPAARGRHGRTRRVDRRRPVSVGITSSEHAGALAVGQTAVGALLIALCVFRVSVVYQESTTETRKTQRFEVTP